MHPMITKLEEAHRKPAVSNVQSGDTVRVHQRIREGSKERVQVFEGVVIRSHRLGSVSATITVRRIASGVGVEKTYLLHSPNVDKVEIIRRAKVRRNFLSYLRGRRGKSARLQEVSFDKVAANVEPVKVQDVTEDPLAVDEPDAVDPVTDLDVDESDDELKEADISTDEVAKEENKAAAEDDDTDESDEALLPAEETESGVDRAEPNNQ
jgi:large subunit ribosomal protein L19